MINYHEAVEVCNGIELGMHAFLFEMDQLPSRVEDIEVVPMTQEDEVVGFQLKFRPSISYKFDYEIFTNLVSRENQVGYVLGKLLAKWVGSQESKP